MVLKCPKIGCANSLFFKIMCANSTRTNYAPVLPHCIVIGQDATRQRVNQMAMNLEKRIEIYCSPLPP